MATTHNHWTHYAWRDLRDGSHHALSRISHPILTPTFGRGESRQDFGKGLYLTPSIDLAQEWAVCNGTDGFLFRLELDTTGLSVLDFGSRDPQAWIAELMSHRDADTSLRYRRFAPLFIRKHGIDTTDYDVIKGWRADVSYFLIAGDS